MHANDSVMIKPSNLHDNSFCTISMLCIVVVDLVATGNHTKSACAGFVNFVIFLRVSGS